MISVQAALLLQDSVRVAELKEKLPELTNEIDEEILSLAGLITDAEYVQAMQSSFAREILPHYLDASSVIEKSLGSLKQNEYDQCAFKYALVGVACLSAFVQLNWTGPNLPLPDDLLPGELTADEINDKLFVEGGETVYEIIRQPKLLIAARSLLCYPYATSLSLFSMPWWAVRCLRVQQTTVSPGSRVLYNILLIWLCLAHGLCTVTQNGYCSSYSFD